MGMKLRRMGAVAGAIVVLAGLVAGARAATTQHGQSGGSKQSVAGSPATVSGSSATGSQTALKGVVYRASGAHSLEQQKGFPVIMNQVTNVPKSTWPLPQVSSASDPHPITGAMSQNVLMSALQQASGPGSYQSLFVVYGPGWQVDSQISLWLGEWPGWNAPAAIVLTSGKVQYVPLPVLGENGCRGTCIKGMAVVGIKGKVALIEDNVQYDVLDLQTLAAWPATSTGQLLGGGSPASQMVAADE